MPKIFDDSAVAIPTTPAPAAPAGFGGPTSGFNTPASSSSTFGSPTTSGFGASASNTTSSGFGAAPAAPTGFGGGSFGSAPSTVPTSSQPIDTSAFDAAIAASAHKPEEHWMKAFWRPAMGWLYMLICACDFVFFPIAWAVVQTINHAPLVQWNPITLQGAGLVHLAFGAILGVAAYGRTQEKKTGAQ